MSDPKHTPGPWQPMLDDSNPNEPRLAVMAGNRIVSETVIHGSDKASRREAAANTRMQAAAPRLAEALKAMTDVFRPRTEPGPDMHAETAAWDNAVAALKEAGIE